MTFEILYNEAHGAVKTADIDAICLLEAGGECMMSRLKAIEVLIREGQRERVTKTGLRKVRTACKALRLDDAETEAVHWILEFPAPPRDRKTAAETSLEKAAF
jgi:hypothetical protein